MERKTESFESVANQSLFSRTVHSIRTRYSLATAFFVLLALAVFYVCGRVVLVHLMREAEQQVKEIGYDISRLAYRQAEEVKRAHAGAAAEVARALGDGAEPLALLSAEPAAGLTLVLHLDGAGRFLAGAARAPGAAAAALSETNVAPYAERFRAWALALDDAEAPKTTVGLVQLGGAAHYAFMLPCGDGGGAGRVVVGAPFDSGVFSGRVSEGFVGLDVRIVNRRAEVSVGVVGRPAPGPAAAREGFGLVPMLSEALNFYSGGFWNLGSSPFEAVFAVRDIAGNAVSMITVSLPSSLSAVTRSALGRLTFSIAVAGILMILPIFWFQSCVLLNPLTKMTKAIRELGENHRSLDCPRLEWEGRDEFALLALSVNRMLETITARALEVAQMEARQRALIEGVPDALAVFDRRGRLASVTKQPVGVPPLPGFAVGEALDADVYGALGAAAFASAVARAFEEGRAQNVRLKVLRPADVPRSVPTRHFEVRVSRMDDFFALAIVRDVTEEVAEHKLRLAAEQRALDASKRESLTVLAAGIAHDVNNVLSVILSTAEAALSGAERDAVKAEMDVIRDAVKRGSAMTRELMAYAGETKVQLMRAKPSVIVKDVQLLAERVIGPNVVLSYELDPDAPEVDVDVGQFWKVLFNIVKNAGEAIGQRPGHITLSTEAFEMTPEAAEGFASERPLAAGRGVMFRVADDGPGIRADLLPRLFDPYVSSKALGRGLGLATVRTIVESHGGGIKVTSRLDRGTTFHIYLPESRLADEPAPEAKPRAEGELPAEVMVVDNDEAILRTTSILLKSLRIKAHVARDRHESLGFLRRQGAQIGAVLLDVNLGGIDTVRLLKAFRLAAPHARIVVSSGSDEESVRRMFGANPFDAFLGKPYTLGELKAILQQERPQ